MNKELRAAIISGELILFLGAGASKGCTTSAGERLSDGNQLAAHLASAGHFDYAGEPLDEVYAAVRAKLGARLDPIIEALFRLTNPSSEYLALASYAWRRIYTLNIDDALETAIRRKHIQNLHIRMLGDPVVDQAPFFDRLDLVKLNGSADQLRNGIIFSPSEYAKATARPLPWYEQCASDFVRFPVLFIGTKLNEPLLKFHIERYKTVTGSSPGKSYVITPTATALQQQALAVYNIEHISGTLSDFVAWLQTQFSKPLTPPDLALASIPQLAEFMKSQNAWKYASLFDHVTPVKKTTLNTTGKPSLSATIQNFYKGYRPTWDDIVNEIPARLDVFRLAMNVIASHRQSNTIIPLIGPAGSGKTTLLMQLCLELANEKDCESFYIEQPIDDLRSTLEAIERSSKASLIIIGLDNIDFMSDQLKEIFSAGRLQRTMIIGAERENIWKRKTQLRLGGFSTERITVDQFTKTDAERILEKLERYGSWTRLGQLSPTQRVTELVVRAQQQLLIALLEATFGLGYGQIIASDFSTLTTEEEKLCFLVVGLITDRKQDAPVGLVDRALSRLGILNREIMVSSHLAGIVINRAGKLAVRHPIYVRYILDNLVDPSLTLRALTALLEAFGQYESPVIKNVNKQEGTIYKGLINHAFLRDVLKGHKDLVLALYRSIEKKYEQDGLYWLQYGLALRDFDEQQEALEKLRTARQAYPMEHTLHALGQQLLIVANHCTDKQTAFTWADEAKEILEGLDKVIDSDDTFPIVTLAEGYTKVVRQQRSEDEARKAAADFAKRLKPRMTQLTADDRLRKAYENMFRYAATGTWVEPDPA